MKRSWLRVLPHIVIWSALILYFFNANQIYAAFFLRNGKPLAMRVNEPVNQRSFEAEDLVLSPMRYDQQDLFQATTEIITPNGKMLEGYQTWLVLESEQQQYVFQLKPGRYSETSDQHIRTYAETYLAREALKPGIYHLGILLEEITTDERSFFWLENILNITHSYLTLKSPNYMGKPVAFNPVLPPASDHIVYFFDGVSKVSPLQEDLHQLYGWFFVKKQQQITNPERFVILQSDQGTYQFAVDKQLKPGFQKIFPEDAPDDWVGFTAYIDRKLVPPGEYRLGILVASEDGSSLFTDTIYNLRIGVEGMNLNKRKSPTSVP